MGDLKKGLIEEERATTLKTRKLGTGVCIGINF